VLIAASHGHCKALQLLLEAGGDACQTDVDGNDAMVYASQSGCQRCCTLITHYSGLYFSEFSPVLRIRFFVTQQKKLIGKKQLQTQSIKA